MIEFIQKQIEASERLFEMMRDGPRHTHEGNGALGTDHAEPCREAP
jgi:hypothetical protein